MTATAGIDAVMKIGSTPVAGVRVIGLTRDATPIDISSQGSDGFVELLDGKHTGATLSFSVDGLYEDAAFQTLGLNPEANWSVNTLSVELANGAVISGSFFFSSYSEGNDYKEATTFTGQFTSAGKWTFTPFIGQET